MRTDRPDLRASGCALAVTSSRSRDGSEMYGASEKKKGHREQKKQALERRRGMNHRDVRGGKAFSQKQKQNKLPVQIKHALFQRLSG